MVSDKELPNHLKINPVVSLTIEDSEIREFLKREANLGTRGRWINKAIRFYYNYMLFRKSFMIQIIQDNYEVAKYLVRRIGRVVTGQCQKGLSVVSNSDNRK